MIYGYTKYVQKLVFWRKLRTSLCRMAKIKNINMCLWWCWRTCKLNIFKILVKCVYFNTSSTTSCTKAALYVPSVRLDSKGTVGTIIKWTSTSTDDIYDGNRRPLNSQHTEDCHLQLNDCMLHVTLNAYIALPTAIPAVVADSVLLAFLPRDGHDRMHIQHYVWESVQSWDASKQLLQGEKKQQILYEETS